ncbi:MAG: CHAD domain-containing protein, partial [Nocardioidaceae bacterium]
VPKRLRDAALLYTRGRRLQAIVRVRTRRRVRRLYDAEDRTLVEVSDDRVTAQAPASNGEASEGPRSDTLATDGQAADGAAVSWREWEVELVEGQRSLLTEVTSMFEHAGATPAAGPSKLARALGDRLPGRAAGADPRIRRDGSAAAVVGTRLREQLAEIKYRDPQVRRDVPDSVHRMRVAMRRLRSALATFRPLLDREKSEPLRDELRWVAGVLGRARDAEVMHERVVAALAEEPVELVVGPVARRVDGQLGGTYRDALARSVEAMTSERYFTLIDRLDVLVAEPPWSTLADQPADQVLPGLVGKDYKRLRRRVAAAADALDQDSRVARLHDVRKATKRARYAAETVEPVYGEDARRFVTACKRVQSLLGEHHDAVVTQPVLRQMGMQAYLDGDNAFSYGLLYGRQQEDAARTEWLYDDAWRRASRKKLRRWLR